MKPDDALDGLAALATGLARDADIGVELTDGTWAFDPVRRVILMSRQSITANGVEHCAGIVAHEVGHFFVSRYTLFDGDFPSAQCRSFMLNAIEDARCETWIMRRYPGTAAWLDDVGRSYAHRQLPQGLPDFLSFALECARERDRHWQPPPDKLGIPAEVGEALELTRDARRRYASLLPPLSAAEKPDAVDDRRRYNDEVLPRLSASHARQAPDAWERLVRVSALDALSLAEGEILPTAARLLAADMKTVASAMRANPALERMALEALEQGGAGPADVVRQAMKLRVAHKRSAGEHLEDLALRLIEALLHTDPPKGLGSALAEDGARSVRAPGVPPPPSAQTQLLDIQPGCDYDRLLHRLQPQIDLLVRQLEEVLVPRQRLRELAGYPSGVRVDLRRLMQFEADPRLHGELWRRKSRPQRRDACFSLLVDLSGSMEGAKAEAALAGTVLLCETLERLGVPFAVNGFQDQLIPFSNFDDGLSVPVRNRLPHMVLETTGNRPGGYNQPGNNDDGPCLLAATGRLTRQHAATRVMIVISDGEPNGTRSGPEELRRAVAAITKAGEVELIAIGLGPDTEHVRKYYPRSVVNVPPSELANQIGRLIADVLLN